MVLPSKKKLEMERCAIKGYGSGLIMIDVDEILKRLARERPVFHSEADFQHTLAWKIHEEYPDMNIRLEKRFELNGKETYVDIYLQNEDERGFIELKYKTEALEVVVGEEKFKLKSQAAQDISRYEFLKDVSRLEECVEKFQNSMGYAVFLTNDQQYWKPPARDTIDRDFRIHEGIIPREGKRELRWKEGAGEGTMKGREEPIILRGRYRVSWQDYSNLRVKNGLFKYLVIKINKLNKLEG